MSEEPAAGRLPHGTGVPRWMPTYAVVMTVLVCFLVLLLSFTDMDVRRYKLIASAMAQGFDSGRTIEADAVPMGASISAHDFAPGPAAPTPISEPYRQGGAIAELQPPPVPEPPQLTAEMKQKLREFVQHTQNDAAQLAGQLEEAIAQGEVEVETRGRMIVLRILEKGSFDSGSADLKGSYRRLLHQVRDTLARQAGVITVRGHTDDVPIATARFHSNWELSAARAVSVAYELLAEGVIDRRRVSIAAFADTRPLAPNDSDEHRARNRRVEIVIDQGMDRNTREQLEQLRVEDRAYYDSLQLGDDSGRAPGESY